MLKAETAEFKNEEINRILDKIRRLFELSKRELTNEEKSVGIREEEQARAMEAAQKLMSRLISLGISQEIIDSKIRDAQTAGTSVAEVEIGKEFVEFFNTPIEWKTALMGSIAHYNGCTAWISKGTRYDHEKDKQVPYSNMYIAGSKLRRVVCINLYQYLVDTIWMLSYNAKERHKKLQEFKGVPKEKQGIRNYTDSYRKGIVVRLSKRLKEAHERELNKGIDADEYGPAVSSLVLLSEWDRNKNALTKYIEDVIGGLEERDAFKVADEEAFAKGFQDGGRISLSKQVERKEGGEDEYGNPNDRGWTGARATGRRAS